MKVSYFSSKKWINIPTSVEVLTSTAQKKIEKKINN